jgi:hypothetical protein
MKNLTTLLSDETGTAFVETLVTIPVLALILTGTLAFNAMYSAKLEAKSRARRFAWLEADSGDCPVETCVGERCQAIETEIRAGGLDALHSARAGRFSLSSFVGNVGRFLLGSVTHSVGFAKAPMPPLLHSEQTSQRGKTTLLCNTTARRTESGSSILEYACSTDLHTTEYAREVCR